jgi:lipid II:glycine glycyltransferase (peptidoglycan interpeptide bridge formation enzyme)
VLDERHLEEFYELYKSHHRKKNYPVRAIDEIRNIFVAYKDKAKIAAIYKGDKIFSAVLFIAHPPYLWLIINVSDFDYSYFQVNNCAYWEVIKYGYDNGIKFVDFGGTSLADKGNIHYKKGFGVDFYPVYSICFFRGWFTGFKYRLQRKIWHLKLRWRVMKSQPRAKQT